MPSSAIKRAPSHHSTCSGMRSRRQLMRQVFSSSVRALYQGRRLMQWLPIHKVPQTQDKRRENARGCNKLNICGCRRVRNHGDKCYKLGDTVRHCGLNVEVLGRKAAVVVKQAGAPHGNAPPGRLAETTRPDSTPVTHWHRLCFAIAAKKRVDGNRNAMQRSGTRWTSGSDSVRGREHRYAKN